MSFECFICSFNRRGSENFQLRVGPSVCFHQIALLWDIFSSLSLYFVIRKNASSLLFHLPLSSLTSVTPTRNPPVLLLPVVCRMTEAIGGTLCSLLLPSCSNMSLLTPSGRPHSPSSQGQIQWGERLKPDPLYSFQPFWGRIYPAFILHHFLNIRKILHNYCIQWMTLEIRIYLWNHDHHPSHKPIHHLQRFPPFLFFITIMTII